MGWIPLYADDEDLGTVSGWLCDDDEVAFIVGNGPECWRAVRGLQTRGDGRFCLWHVPSGPLPLLPADAHSQTISTVADPWKGWRELRAGAVPSEPYFGAGHVGVVWFNANAQGTEAPGSIGMSSFEWIGDHYKIIGHPAPKVTHRWWSRLRGRIRRVAVRIPREGASDGPSPEIWALPSALRRIESGAPRDTNP